MTYRFVPNFALRVIQIVILTEAIVRGLNYIATPSDQSALYTAAEQSAPLAVWGGLFMFFGALGILGEVWMGYHGSKSSWNIRAWPSFVAHIGLLVCFLSFAVSAAAGVVTRDPIYGFVSPYDFVVFAVAHWAFARRRHHG